MCQSFSPVSLDAGEDTNRSSRRPTAKLSRSAGGRPWGYCAQHLPDDLIAARTRRLPRCRLQRMLGTSYHYELNAVAAFTTPTHLLSCSTRESSVTPAADSCYMVYCKLAMLWSDGIH